MNCNPWYIFKYMHEKYPNYKYVWLLNNEPKEKIKDVIYVKKNTLKWVKEILTSKILINNHTFNAYFPYRKKQVLIQTWHGGGAYKKVNLTWKSEKNVINTKKTFIYAGFVTTYYLSSCEYFSNLTSIDTFVDYKKFLPIGMPRNDIFFDASNIHLANTKVRQKYNISDKSLVVLYAPTYRGYWSTGCLNTVPDLYKIKKAFGEKYNKNVKILFRGHSCIKNINNEMLDFDENVSSYPDMQELLCASDVMITDYSSSMWDYSFLYRPCFLFTPDLQEYIDDRGFYTDPYSWGFPICQTNEELVDSIKKFDENIYVTAIKKHHDNLGSFEKGTATVKIVNCINQLV